MKTLVAGGTVVTAGGVSDADVLIEGERVIGVVAPGSHAFAADRMVDATGKLVLPGGVDVHTHMELPAAGTVSSDTFETGTRAAAFGGTTTIVDFGVQTKGGRLLAGLEEWMAKAEGRCAVDYGFHLSMTDVTDASLGEMSRAVEQGVTSFKLFMAYPGVNYSTDGEIVRAMRRAADLGATILMHAENGIAIDALAAEAIAAGRTGPSEHGRVRSPILEGEATNRAIALAEVTGARLYVVHLSARQALDAVGAARRRGLDIHAETCPQYLFLDLGDLDAGGAEYVCSPPLRDRAEGHQAALWGGLVTGDLAVVSTDHCPFTSRAFDDLPAQKRMGGTDFRRIPNGLPGVEHRLELVFSGGVTAGRMSLERFVDVCATAPARLFGLYPRKGTIEVGSDADLVVFDPRRRHTLSAASHHMRTDYSVYEGFEVTGKVESVLLRGEVIVADDTYQGRAGDGDYLSRSRGQAS